MASFQTIMSRRLSHVLLTGSLLFLISTVCLAHGGLDTIVFFGSFFMLPGIIAGFCVWHLVKNAKLSFVWGILGFLVGLVINFESMLISSQHTLLIIIVAQVVYVLAVYLTIQLKAKVTT